MLRSLKGIRGLTVEARDGAIGEVEDLYFDDQSWAVRYYVVDTGKWLPGRKVLNGRKAKAPTTIGRRGLFCGRHWIRTSDFHRVRMAL